MAIRRFFDGAQIDLGLIPIEGAAGANVNGVAAGALGALTGTVAGVHGVRGGTGVVGTPVEVGQGTIGAPAVGTATITATGLTPGRVILVLCSIYDIDSAAPTGWAPVAAGWTFNSSGGVDADWFGTAMHTQITWAVVPAGETTLSATVAFGDDVTGGWVVVELPNAKATEPIIGGGANYAGSFGTTVHFATTSFTEAAALTVGFLVFNGNEPSLTPAAHWTELGQDLVGGPLTIASGWGRHNPTWTSASGSVSYTTATAFRPSSSLGGLSGTAAGRRGVRGVAGVGGVSYLLSDDFTGTNGDAPNATNWPYIENNTSATIQSNRLDLRPTVTTAYAAGAIFATTATQVYDCELTFDWRVNLHGGAENYWRVSGFHNRNYAGGFEIQCNVHTPSLSIREGGTPIGSDGSLPTLADGDIVHFRWQIIGMALKLRWWLNGASEPGTWNMERTGATGGGATAQMLLEVINGGSAVARYQQFDAVRFAAPGGAPASSLGGLTGTASGSSGAPPVYGTAAGAFGGLTGTALGVGGTPGSAAASLGNLAGTANGRVGHVASLSGALGGLSGTILGRRGVRGTSAGPFGGLTGTAAGGKRTTGTAVGAFGALTGTVVGRTGTPGVAVGPLGGLTGTVAGRRGVRGTVAKSLGGLTGTAAGVRRMVGTAQTNLGALTGTALGSTGTPGAGASTLGGLTGTVTGRRGVRGAIATGLGALSASASILPTGVIAQSLGALTGTATGRVGHRGTAASNLGALTGTVAGVGGTRGAAVAAFGALVGTAQGRRGVRATITQSLGALTATATGRRSVRGTGAATFGFTGTVAGNAGGSKAGTAVGAFGALAGTGTGRRGVRATIAQALGVLTGTVAGRRGVRGLGASNLGALTGHSDSQGGKAGTAIANLGALVAHAVGTRHVTGTAEALLGFIGTANARAIDGWVCLDEGLAFTVALSESAWAVDLSEGLAFTVGIVERAPSATLGEHLAATVTLTIDPEC